MPQDRVETTTQTEPSSTAETIQEQENVPVIEPLPVTLVLPNGLPEMEIFVQPTTTLQEIRQVVFDSPNAQFLTCFYLSFNGNRLNEMSEICMIEGFQSGSRIQVIADVYTEHQVRVHVNRLREILSNFEISSNGFGIDAALSVTAVVSSKASPAQGKDEEEIKDNQNEAAKSTAQSLFQNYPFGEIASSIENYIPSSTEKHEKCLESISISSWNPPPFSRKMAGDIMYLTVHTLEGTVVEVTCSATGFFVNQSSAKKFNPAQCKNWNAHTLPAVLSLASPLFADHFTKLQAKLAARHPFEYITTFNPAYPWTVKSKPHTSDAGRCIDIQFAAADTLETLTSRDWNEDLQIARELPRESASERVNRDQSFARAHADFIEAATRGAIAIVNKSISPLQTIEAETSQIYIHNNIFLSLGYDNRDQFDDYGGEAAAHVAVSKDIDGIRLVSGLDKDGLCTLGTAVIDYMGRRIVAQTIVPGILKRSDNQEPAVQYGSIDSGKHIVAKKDFKELLSSVSTLLYAKDHQVVDENEESHSLYTSIDVKGVLGTDSRRYLLDLYRICPVDIGFLEKVKSEKDSNPYPHEMTLVRPELMELYYHVKSAQAIQEHEKLVEEYKKRNGISDSKEGEESKEVKKEVTEPEPQFEFSLLFNPDVFTHAKLDGTPEEIKKQEDDVRELSAFIYNSIGRMMMEFMAYPGTAPLDGEALTKSFHRRGINMRYLGYVVEKLDAVGSDNPLRFLRNLCIQEMVARAAKALLRSALAELEPHTISQCVSHFFNCLFSSKDAKLSPPEFLSSMTPSSVEADIKKQVLSRFRYTLSDQDSHIRHLALLRSICLKVGIQIESFKYDFSSKSGIFQDHHILNLYPIIKHVSPRSQFAEQAQEHGHISLNHGKKEIGLELIKESITIYEQVLGPIHPDTGKAYAQLAMLYFKDESYEEACQLQKRAVIVTERTRGLDDSETLQQYMNLAYFEFMAGRVELGLLYSSHALKFWEFATFGESHADTASAYSNIASMTQKLGLLELSHTFYTKAADLNESLYGSDSPQTMASYDTLVRSCFMLGQYRDALVYQRKVYQYYKAQVGEEDHRTKDHFETLNVLTTRAVESAKRDLLLKKNPPSATKSAPATEAVPEKTQTSTTTSKKKKRPIR